MPPAPESMPLRPARPPALSPPFALGLPAVGLPPPRPAAPDVASLPLAPVPAPPLSLVPARPALVAPPVAELVPPWEPDPSSKSSGVEPHATSNPARAVVMAARRICMAAARTLKSEATHEGIAYLSRLRRHERRAARKRCARPAILFGYRTNSTFATVAAVARGALARHPAETIAEKHPPNLIRLIPA
jgi:hypothetical protein